jgi:hypothetical protein
MTNEINATTDSTPAATGSVTDQISALLMEEQSPQPAAKKEPKAAKPKAPESEPELPPSEDSMDSDDDEEGSYEKEEVGETDQEDTDETEDSDSEDDSGDATWSKVLGVPEDKVVLDDDGEFAGFKIKVDGKVEVIPAVDLIAGFQNNKSNTLKSKALAEEKKQLESHKTQLLQEYGNKIKDAEALTTYLENSLVKEYQGVDWNNLRYSNPGEYAALVQDYNIRVDEIQKIKTATDTVKQQETEKYQQEFGQRTQAYIQEQVQLAIEKHPEWQDTKKFKAALGDMQNFVSDTYGFSAQEFADVKDARILDLILDAKKYRAGKVIAEQKIAKPVGKFQKPTGQVKATKTKLEQLTSKAKASSGYAKHAAETDAVAELLKNIY